MASSFNVADLLDYVDLDKQSLLSEWSKLRLAILMDAKREIDI